MKALKLVDVHEQDWSEATEYARHFMMLDRPIGWRHGLSYSDKETLQRVYYIHHTPTQIVVRGFR